MTVGIFVAFFIQRPSAALERNAIFMPWVSIVLTTFWTRLLYLDDPATLDAQLGKAAKDASDELSMIASRYASIDQHELAVAKEAARTRPRPAAPCLRPICGANPLIAPRTRLDTAVTGVYFPVENPVDGVDSLKFPANSGSQANTPIPRNLARRRRRNSSPGMSSSSSSESTRAAFSRAAAAS